MRALLRGARKRARSARYRLRERRDPTLLGSDEVAEALRQAGLGEGDAVFFQAAMSAFGSFEAGSASVIYGLERALGAGGLAAMPAFTLDATMQAYIERDLVFDARATPSRMGRVSEDFRCLDGTVRSVHPTHSVTARGAGATTLVAGSEATPVPFGEGTPFARLAELDAWQVFFGCGTGPMTIYHCFECLRRPPFPLAVFAECVYEARCLDLSGDELVMRTLAHDLRYVSGRIDSSPRIQAIYREAILAGGGKCVSLGRGEIIAIRISSLFEVFERLLGERQTIYEHDPDSTEAELTPQARALGDE